jgi:hypothetical protein
MALTANTNVASTVASYFTDNFQAFASSAAYQPRADWLAANQGKNFYLIPTAEGSFKLSKVDSNDATAISAAVGQSGRRIDGAAAYAIEKAGGPDGGDSVAVDWLMAQISQEFRQTAATQSFGPLLTSTPEANLQFDLSNLDTATLIRLLGLLTGRNRDTVAQVAAGRAKDIKSNIALMGLAVSNLSTAVELQTRFQGQAGPTTGTATEKGFDEITKSALGKLVSNSSSELQAARLAVRNSIVGQQDNNRLSRLTQIGFKALDTQLQAAADLSNLINPEINRFLSALDFEQNKDGFVIKTQVAMARENQAIKAVVADLVKALTEPELAINLADALAANADELGLSDLTLPEQTSLLQDVAKAIVSSVVEDEAYLQNLAAQSVAFHVDIANLIRNEVVAASERDLVTNNV